MRNTIISASTAIAIFAAVPAYAACENEAREFNEFSGYCNTASALSQILAPTIFGGLAAGAVAQNQCRIMKEKQAGLNACTSAVQASLAAELLRAQAEADEARKREEEAAQKPSEMALKAQQEEEKVARATKLREAADAEVALASTDFEVAVSQLAADDPAANEKRQALIDAFNMKLVEIETRMKVQLEETP